MPLLTLFLIAAQAGNVAPPPIERGDVVVTGRRYANDLARCLASGCSPEQEVEAALAAAVEHFRNGRYEDALQVLRRAIGRNKQYAARMPGKISDLHATYADVSWHYGSTSGYKFGSWSSVDVLREHLGKTHPATLTAASGVGDMLATIGQASSADEVYHRSARDAAANGQPRIAALMTFRRAWLAFGQRQDARVLKLLDEVGAFPADDPRIATLVRALRVRLALRRKDDAAVDRLLAEWRTSAGERPVLVYEPPAPILDTAGIGTFGDVPIQRNAAWRGAVRDVDWVDIGYWVRPSGQTAEVEVLRSQGAKAWATPLLGLVANYRYVPLSVDPGSPGVYQIRRYSLRRELGVQTGSRIVTRVGPLTIVQTDMTRAEAMDDGRS